MPARDPDIELALLQARKGCDWKRKPLAPYGGARPGGIADRAWRLATRWGWDKRKEGQWVRR